MANVVATNYFREQMSIGHVNLSGDTFLISLMDRFVQSASVDTLKQVSAWSDVSAHEVSALGYSAINLSSKSISIIPGNVISWDGANIVWSGVTLTTYGYAVYKNNGLVVGFVEFAAGQLDAVNGSVTIQWNTNGIMNII
jgi:hypothetical protein